MDSNRVCRDIDIEIPSHSGSGFVVAKSAPISVVYAKDFFNHIIKQSNVEHLSHPTLIDMGVTSTKHSLFLQVLHNAFANHWPVALSPEVLMYLVLHEIAITVKRYEKEYRGVFTTSDDKQLIHVRHDGLVMCEPSPWGEVLDLFYLALKDRVPNDIMQQLLPDFSTHTRTSCAGSTVAFMDIVSSYYSYKVVTSCGIPKIRLLGRSEDYRKLHFACVQLSKLFRAHLGKYFDFLLPVLEKIAGQAAGASVDNTFWMSIYKHLSNSGTDSVTGWITAFMNYTSTQQGFSPKRDSLYNWQMDWDSRSHFQRGLERCDFPSHISQTPFIWDYLGQEKEMKFLGGIMTVENRDGFLTPRIGFGVMHAS